jgi:predicted PhzF superfamily epimerase YddE/YHI9
VPPETARALVSLQGVAMGRPSRIHISIDGARDAITRVRVGGTAVLVGGGELRV